MEKVSEFELQNGTPLCPVCGIRRTAIRSHIALAAGQERKRHLLDQHWKFYIQYTDKEIIVRRKWKI